MRELFLARPHYPSRQAIKYNFLFELTTHECQKGHSQDEAAAQPLGDEFRRQDAIPARLDAQDSVHCREF